MPLPKKRLDRIVNIILGIHPAGQHFLMRPQVFVQHVDEVARAIGACDLAAAEHVADRRQLVHADFIESPEDCHAIIRHLLVSRNE
jgi:hypothetical protein